MKTMDEPEAGYIAHVLQWTHEKNDTSFDFTIPYIRRSLRYVYPLFIFLYAVVGLVGLIGNITMLIIIGKQRLYRDSTYLFIGNLAFSDLIKCTLVLPISLANMVVQNWVFGSFLCFFLPMIQFFPIHASMLTFLVTAIDRYRLILYPFKTRVPVGLCIIASWVGAVCVVLPHAFYIKYIDLGALFGVQFYGVGLCYVSMERNIEEYLRAMFVILYTLPLAIIAFLYVKISAELKSKVATPLVVQFGVNNASPSLRNAHTDEEISAKVVTLQPESNGKHTDNGNSKWNSKTFNGRSIGQGNDDDIDVAKEKRTQTYLIGMVTFFAICWCPMNILVLVHYFVNETEKNSGYIDIIFITFAWFGYLSTCINPFLFASWCMSSATQDRLKGYFQFNNRRRSSSQVSRTEVTESYVIADSPSPRHTRKTSAPKVKIITNKHELTPFQAAML